MVTTRDDELAERVRLLRFHGSKAKKDFELVGYNSRLDELQAAVLRLFLPRVDEWNRARREAAARYAQLGLGEVCELPADEPGHVYHVFVVRSPERDRIREHLASSEIASTAYYETPLHLQPALRSLGHSKGEFPETERASEENLALPLWAGIDTDVQERVVSAVREAVSLEAVR
jgi:dTDP-4-amino-4,6-dideoxygalactose transaminase